MGIVSSVLQFLGFKGTAARPAYSFNKDTNTGVFNPAADQLGFATAGVQQAILSASGLNVTGVITTADGNTTTPGLSFALDASTGFYRFNTAAISISLGGVEWFRFSGNTAQEAFRMTTVRPRGTGGFYNAWYDPSGLKGYVGYGSLTNDTLALVNQIGAILLAPNNVEAFTIQGASRTGTGTPSFAANKPGADATVAVWVPVTVGLTNYWLPLWGN